jgi:hypothetical protein
MTPTETLAATTAPPPTASTSTTPTPPSTASASIAPTPPPTTSASIAPSLSPDRLHAKAALTFAIRYEGGELGVPSPVRAAVLALPAGLTLEIPVLRSCSATRLEALGARGCPAGSEIGTGHAVVVGNLGTKPVAEDLKLLAFLGPPHNLQPTFEILGEGAKPLSVQMALTAVALPARAPYGEELALTIPPIPTVPGEPDASVVSFSLTIGASARGQTRGATTVVVPSHCPRGGLPFAATFTYADGARGRAVATVPCPTRPRRAARPARATQPARPAGATRPARPARAARTISLSESGNLHLTSRRGFTLDEQGIAAGTLAGTIYVHLRIVSTSSVTAEVSIVARGGSISGEASANYRRGNSTASFSGTLSIGRGTGSYGAARGSGLSFGGTIQRSNDAIAVRVSGKVSE